LARRVAAVAVVGVSSLLVAACGGGQARTGVAGLAHRKTVTTSRSVSSFDASGLEYSVCMRKHGVPEFPDPIINGYHYSLNVSGTAGAPAPVFQAAQQACAKYSPSFVPPGSVTASYLKQMLAAAECMRAHGVIGFPDPTTSPGFKGTVFKGTLIETNGVYFAIPSSVDLSSPSVQHAASACNFGL
jgi:hypothetical protein